MPYQLRELFANLLIHCEPTNPENLWRIHQTSLSEDFIFRFPNNLVKAVAFTLQSLDDLLRCHGSENSLASFNGVLPQLKDYEHFLRHASDNGDEVNWQLTMKMKIA